MKKLNQWLAVSLLGSLASCAAIGPATVSLVETTPVGTVLGSPEIPETSVVWLKMIEGARESIDLCHFYLHAREGDLLTPIIHAIEDAAARGVRVRFLAGEKFQATYPELIERFTEDPHVDMVLWNMIELTGGVQHSKYMVIDGNDTYLGSANFDWRALEHIQELGLRIHSEQFGRALLDVFDHDWALAQGKQPPVVLASEKSLAIECLMDPAQVRGKHDLWVTLRPAFSPTGLLPDESTWDLPLIKAMIDAAEKTLYLQVLTLDLVGYDGKHFEELEDALVRAAARGVRVRILVADWCDRKGVIEGLRDLAALEGIGLRLVTIPEHTGGHIPFARVIHAKYLIADHKESWLGTSNWERGYFFKSRNVGVMMTGDGMADRLEHFFRTNWFSSYAVDVDDMPAKN
ncbi:MAG: phosphatidylserine/phosphatidylglycerophosphate/cardiolipin synthase-like enzyme [Glaciecola sp.]|jgi:phosphatidylserine/phosphatidylglycerophosphate/cardiolipin synthase-like enzyme